MQILSADFGTSSLKLAVLDERLSVLASRRVEYGYKVEREGGVEIDPRSVLSAFVEGVRSLGDHARKVDALSPCTFCPSLVAMDGEGNALFPVITHLDRRSVSQARKALAIVGRDAFLGINGNLPFPGGISLTSILWLKDNHPGIYEKTRTFGHFNTYLHRALAGRPVIDPTNASFTGLYETLKWGDWSEELCSALGIDTRKLPRIVMPATVIGGLSASLAAGTGLPEGLPVVMGANDSSSAAYGAGVVDGGSILNISGSNEIVTIALERPLPHEKVYLRTHVVRGKWLCLAITVGGSALEWFRRELCREMSRDAFYGRYLPDLVGRRFGGAGGKVGVHDGGPEVVSRAGCPREKGQPIGIKNRGLGIFVRFAPHLAGDRHRIEQRKASFTGLTLGSTREDMLTAVLLGVMGPMKTALEVYGEKISLADEIALTGGLSDSVPVAFKERVFPGFRFRPVPDAAAIGNGRLALEALGVTP